MKLDRTRPFGKVIGDHHLPELDRSVFFEQGGRYFDAEGREIIPRRPLVTNSANASSRRPEALTKEYESLLKLLAGMAQGAYRWDSAQVQCVTAEILNDASAVGLNIDKNAVIELLGQAAQLIVVSDLKSDSLFVPSTLAWCLEDRDILLMLVGAMAKGGYAWRTSQAAHCGGR